MQPSRHLSDQLCYGNLQAKDKHLCSICFTAQEEALHLLSRGAAASMTCNQMSAACCLLSLPARQRLQGLNALHMEATISN